MLRPFDIVIIGVMAAAATVTYKIKHLTDNKAAEVRRLEAEIRMEKDTIDLLKADLALLTQPNRLDRLVNVYSEELKLQPTAPEQLALPVELPMRRDELPVPEVPADQIAQDPVRDLITTGSVER
ncbi:hypothetical protein FE840_015595 [Peteryoungia desertarenae]|uniref:Uncharacterized protein n=1 Tax=Peteryoungia desertarenae TaxID=1813451 RepID=A0ABX6QRG3_9HYPH|nr:hypothetical protein [Peteryoungia desertarenae]QLF70852.1 hypothetical protein FE840_015595 [Peteryoungia desertarenae]